MTADILLQQVIFRFAAPEHVVAGANFVEFLEKWVVFFCEVFDGGEFHVDVCIDQFFTAGHRGQVNYCIRHAI